MKVFIKHWNKEIRPYIHNPADKEIGEYWWRAALRWTLDSCVLPNGMINHSLIEKELEQ